MDHGQLQMGTRIVDGKAAALGHDHDYESHQGQQALRGGEPEGMGERAGDDGRAGWRSGQVPTGREWPPAAPARTGPRWSWPGWPPCPRRRSPSPGPRGPGRPSRATTGRRRRRGRPTTHRPGSVATSGAMAATTTVAADQHQRGQGEDPARVVGPGPLPAGQLPEVEEGLADGWPGPAFQPATHRPHQTDQERTADHHPEHLEQRDRHHRGGRPARPHPTTTSTTTSATSPKAR